MIFEKTATTVSLQATRQLSRQRPLTILLLYAISALFIAVVSYNVTFSIVLLPLASLSFSLLERTPSYPTSSPPLLPRFSQPRATGAASLHDAPARANVSFASLPMRRPEAQLLLSYLRASDVYLEFGASGTTLAVPPLVAAAFSVEHDVHVCRGINAEMRRHPRLAASLRAFCVRVETKHAGWGTLSPFEEGSYAAFQNYVDLPRLNLSRVLFDRVLLNGRARVACALRVLPQLKKSSLVFFHDFFLRPAHYAAVLPFYEEVGRVLAHGSVHGYTDEPMGLLVLRPREQYLTSDVSVSRINAIYAQYEEQAPSEASTQLQTAHEHGLLKSDEGGFDYAAMSAQLSRQSTRVRLLLDLVALPFVLLTYMVLRDVFRKLFLHALCTSSPRAHRLLGGDVRAAASAWSASRNSRGGGGGGGGGGVLVMHTKSASMPPPTAVAAKAE